MEGLPISASRDGRYLIYRTNSTTGTDLHLILLNEGFRSEKLLTSAANEVNAEISPDGHWLVYQVDQSDKPEVFVRPFPKVDDGMWKISVEGGSQPTWSHNGEEIFFVAGASLMSARVRTGAVFQHERPQAIISSLDDRLRGIGRSYDFASDGQHVLVNIFGEVAAETNRVVIVTNWFSELERLVPAS